MTRLRARVLANLFEIILLLCVAPSLLPVLHAQNPPGQATRIKSGSSLLGTPCNYTGGNTDFFIQTGTGAFYCKSGTWQQLQDSGSSSSITINTTAPLGGGGTGTTFTLTCTGCLTSVTAHNLLSATHGDTTPASAVRGDGIFAIGATPTWQRLAHPSTTGGYFKWNGTDIVASSGAAGGTGNCASHNFQTGDNADASPTCAQPAAADLSDGTTGSGAVVLAGSPALTGNPTAPTQVTSDNSTKIATTAFVQAFAPGGSGAITLQHDGSNNGSQAILNLISGLGITVADNGSGGITITGPFAWGGDGSDGAQTFDGSSTILGLVPSTSVYTLTRDIFCTNLTVNSGVTIKTNNFAIFFTGTLTVNGTIQNDGATGANGSNAASSSGASGGGATNAAGSSTARFVRLSQSIAGTAGGAGGTGAGSQAPAATGGNTSGAAVDSSGSSGSSGNAGGKGGDGTSGSGGAARAGGSGGAVASVAGSNGHNAVAAHTGSFVNLSTQLNSFYTPPSGGNGGAPGGSGGGGDGVNAGGGGGGGGGEGGGAGMLAIFGPTIVVGASGRISCNGGTGGTGGNGFTPTLGNTGGGGGGAGGSGGRGGILWLVYHKLTNSGTIAAAGGSGGSGGGAGSPHGSGTNNAATGSNGPTGTAGALIQLVN